MPFGFSCTQLPLLLLVSIVLPPVHRMWDPFPSHPLSYLRAWPPSGGGGENLASAASSGHNDTRECARTHTPVQLAMVVHAASAAATDAKVAFDALWPLAHHFDLATAHELAARAHVP